ncbi:MAG: PAS domain-containing protein, partial [Hypericibacter sp.]
MQPGLGDIWRLTGTAILPPLLVLLLLAGGGWLAIAPALIGAGLVILLAGLGIYAWRRLEPSGTPVEEAPAAEPTPEPEPAEPPAPAVADRVLQALPDPVLLVDGERHVIQANAAAESQFGRNAVGRDLSAMVRHPALIDAVEAVLEGGPGREVELV